jgi:hypothetical protein
LDGRKNERLEIKGVKVAAHGARLVEITFNEDTRRIVLNQDAHCRVSVHGKEAFDLFNKGEVSHSSGTINAIVVIPINHL